MAKRIIKEDFISHDRWMVSYADFLTLLLAFFVVMYSVSQLNDAKYRVLSETMIRAFNIPQRSLTPIQVGEPVAAVNPGVVEKAIESPEQKPASGHVDEEEPKATTSEPQLPEEFRKISQRVEEDFRELVDRRLVSVHGNEEWLSIELKSSLLFDSGAAEPSYDADPIISQLAVIVRDSQLPIRVEGFTDDEPIASAQFPSNWELSSARAASIVKILADNGVDAARLAAVGYGEFQPVADNDTEAGRAANRRVVLMISRNARLRPQLSPAPLAVGTGPAPATEPAAQDVTPSPQSSSRDVNSSATPDAKSGMIRVELEGGGLLFTNDPARGGAGAAPKPSGEAPAGGEPTAR